MLVTLEIPENKYQFFKTLMQMLSFPKIVNEVADENKTLISKEEFFEGLRESFEEVKLYKQGKIELKDARKAMQEIEKELENESNEIYESVERALIEVKEHLAGKKELKDIKERLNEL